MAAPPSWTPYADLNQVLQELVARVSRAIPRQLVGIYLQGSFAVGDFDEHSDADFIVVTERELEPAEVGLLQSCHRDLYDLESSWAKHLEGSYFPKALLATTEHRGVPLWFLDHGASSLVLSDHCDTAVVRTVLRDCGVALVGPPLVGLVAAVPVAELRSEIRAGILEWGQDILRDPTPYRNRHHQGYIVLKYCRMLHALATGTVKSKRTGANWATTELDPAWASLIERAWHVRPDPFALVKQPPDSADFNSTLAFVQYCMDYSVALPPEAA